MAARSLNGGLMELSQLRVAVLKRRGRTADPVSDEDILRAIDSLKCVLASFSFQHPQHKVAHTASQRVLLPPLIFLRPPHACRCLGGGWAVLDLPGRKVIRSVPAELNADTTAILEEASATGYVSAEGVGARRGWAQMRTVAALDTLLRVSARIRPAHAIARSARPAASTAESTALNPSTRLFACRMALRWWMTGRPMECACSGSWRSLRSSQQRHRPRRERSRGRTSVCGAGGRPFGRGTSGPAASASSQPAMWHTHAEVFSSVLPQDAECFVGSGRKE